MSPLSISIGIPITRLEVISIFIGGVDSNNKRYSMFGLFLPFARLIPVPDGGFANAADRRHLSYGYAGIV